MIIKTERLIIRKVEADDWIHMKNIWEDFNKSAYAQYDTPHSTKDDDVRIRIARWADFKDSTEHIFFAICLSSKVIGYVAFNKRENSHEIGYCFHSDYHGLGYAKESLLALFDYLHTIGITKFTAGTALKNTPSVSLLQSLKFDLISTEKITFYKNSDGEDIFFEGGNFFLDLS